VTPDDIRNATFDSVRRGLDPEQVRDLLARVAFVLECRHVNGVADIDRRDERTDAGRVDDELAHALDASAPLVDATQAPAIDYQELSDRLDQVIAAAQQLVTWKATIDQLRPDGTATHAAPCVGSTSDLRALHTGEAEATTSAHTTIEIPGLDRVQLRRARTNSGTSVAESLFDQQVFIRENVRV
jgi:DivIVA domain-containing protein